MLFVSIKNGFYVLFVSNLSDDMKDCVRKDWAQKVFPETGNGKTIRNKQK